MTNAHSINDVDTPRKCCDIPALSDIKTLEDLPAIVNQARRNTIVSEEQRKIKPENSGIQYRYIVTLFGFLTYFELDCYRTATSMSIVKMMNNTAVSLKKNLNNTIDSCPLYDTEMEEILLELDTGGEYNWSPEIQGYILSAGFLGYVISQIPGGLAAETYGAKKVYLGGVLLASLAHMLSPFAAWCNCYLLIGMQLLRGVGQGFQSPANSVIAAKWFPMHERGFLNSLIFLGEGVGSFATYLTSGVICSSNMLGGWPSVYFIYGGLGLILSICIHLFLYESPKDHPKIGKVELLYILENQECNMFLKKPPTPWGKILTSVPVYVMTFSIFSHFWAQAHQMSEHPIFLANILHFSIRKKWHFKCSSICLSNSDDFSWGMGV